MSGLSISLLGSFEGVIGGRPLTHFRTKAVQALLIYLVCQPESHAREALMTLLWPDLPLKSAQANLRHALYHLKQVVSEVSGPAGEAIPFVLSDRQTVQVNPDGRFHLDITQFEALTQSQELEDWQTAVSLYRGDFLNDFFLPDSPDFETWAQTRRADLRRRFLDTLVRLTDHHLKNDNFEQAEQYARQQLAVDNLGEEAHRQLMTVLAKSGRRPAALTHYQTLRHLLQNELKIEPSSETESLVAAIRADTLTSANNKQEVIEDTTVSPHNLPAQATPFIGRQTELAALDDLLADPQTRLVTILGAGGMGKTRLSLAAAERQLPRQMFPQGIFFVPLTGLGESDRIVPAIAEAMDFRLEKGERQLFNYLQARGVLLILDNFEHLLDAGELVVRLLDAAPRLQILVTSRERLRLHGEQVYPLQGLVVDETAIIDDARALFLQAARRLRPDFQVTAEDQAILNQICRLTEGMPLAIELAAAWVDLLTPAEIAAEIQRNLDFLESDWRDMPARHRSMRAVFDTTWQQLTEREQRLLAQMSIFRGGFTREAVTALTGATIRDLSRLVNKSLLRFVGEKGRFSKLSTPRYHIHELLRQYCATYLPAESELVERFNSYYCHWLKAQKADLHSPQQAETVQHIQADMDNIRKAIAGRVSQNRFSDLQPTLAALHSFYIVRGKFHEAITLFNELAHQLAGQPNLTPHTHVWLLIWLSSLNGMIIQQNESDKRWQQAKEVLQHPIFQNRDTRAEKANIILQEGYSFFRTKSENSVQLFRESVALFEAIDDPVSLAHSLLGLGRGLRNMGEYAEACDAFSRSLSIAEELGDPYLQLEPQLLLGFQKMTTGHPEEAEEDFEEVIAQIKMANHPERLRMGLRYLSFAQMMNGRFAAALETSHKRRQAEIESGSYNALLSPEGYANALFNLHLGLYDEASKIEQVLDHSSPDQYLISDAHLVSGLVAIAQGELAKAQKQFQASQTHYVSPWVCGWIHRYQIGQALVAAMTGEFTTAQQLIHEELQFYLEKFKQERCGPAPIMFILAVQSYLYAAQGKPERAIELYGLAQQNKFIANSRWVADVIGKRITAVAQNLSPETIAAAQAKGKTLGMWQTAESLLADFQSGQ
jgi:DNA-binding SARP family transcriptional activator